MKYSVDSVEVSHAATRVRSSSATIHSEVAAMMGHLIALQSAWTGSASAAFEGLSHSWQMTQAQIEANLDQIALALDAAASSYADTESAAARMFAH